jgi:hypothetical protein
MEKEILLFFTKKLRPTKQLIIWTYRPVRDMNIKYENSMYKTYVQEVRENKWGQRNNWRSKQTLERCEKKNTTVKGFVNWVIKSTVLGKRQSENIRNFKPCWHYQTGFTCNISLVFAISIFTFSFYVHNFKTALYFLVFLSTNYISEQKNALNFET